jgi:AcrR family transcriptional regulator
MTAMNTEPAVRRSAREELAAITHTRAMEALAALLREGSDVTFEHLSRESGIPVRTLYRYFENKEALFAAFWPWLNKKIDVPDRPRDAGELIAHIPGLFDAFDRDEPLVRAMLHHPHGREARLAHAAARREKFAEALSEVTRGMPTAEGRRLLAAVTALCSASGWETMKDNWALSGPAAAEAAQWAIHSLINEARRGTR